jgi:hypothetical protein
MEIKNKTPFTNAFILIKKDLALSQPCVKYEQLIIPPPLYISAWPTFIIIGSGLLILTVISLKREIFF